MRRSSKPHNPQPGLFPTTETDPIEARIAGMIDRAERGLRAAGCTRQANGSWAPKRKNEAKRRVLLELPEASPSDA